MLSNLFDTEFSIPQNPLDQVQPRLNEIQHEADEANNNFLDQFQQEKSDVASVDTNDSNLLVQHYIFDQFIHMFDKKDKGEKKQSGLDKQDVKNESIFDMIKSYFDQADDETGYIAKMAKNHPNVHRTIKEIVEYNGFNFENHTVTTEDGYVLEMHRLYANLSQPLPENATRPVLMMQHGIVATSETFVINGNESQAFYFAREGYDVWLGNDRESLYGRKHIDLDPDDPEDAEEFFDFSFYEMGKYDAPAQIDYIRNSTGNDKLSYVGHSQGTTQIFTALAEGFGDLDKKINLFVALAPVTTVGGPTEKKFSLFMDTYPFIKSVLNSLDVYELFGPTWAKNQIMICNIFPDFCQEVALSHADIHDDSLDELVVRIANARTPTPCGLKQMEHFGQIKGNGVFARFDNMIKTKNKQQYGDKFGSHPPIIDLSKINGKVPISLFVGAKDGLATVYDNDKLYSIVGNVTIFSYQVLPDFGHSTFTYGKDKTIQKTIMEQLKLFNPINSKEIKVRVYKNPN